MKNTAKFIYVGIALLLVTACGLPTSVQSPVTINTPGAGAPVSGGNTPSGGQSQPPATSPSFASNSPTLAPPTQPPAASNGTSSDKTEPNLTNVGTSVTEAYYHDNGCGTTTVTVFADVSDDSGKVSAVWADYQYVSMSAGVGGNQWYRVNLQPSGNGHYAGVIDLTLKADGELQGNDGTLQYQVFASDAAGNTRSVPDGSVYGVAALACPPQAQPPGGNNNASITITNLTAYPQSAVYYGNCSSEETLFNLQATIEPLSLISSVTMYYAYTGPNGTFGNYSAPMSILGIGDYAGDADVGAEAAFPLGTSDGTLDAYVNVIDVNGNSIDSNWVSIPVVYCPGSAVGQPPQQPTVAQGSGNLYNNYSLDLGDDNGDDVIFSHTSGDGLQLLSVWGTELQVNLYQDVATCQNAIDTGNTFSAVSIDPQDVVCYKTGSGNYGYLVIDGIFADLDNHDNSYVDISYTTEIVQ